MTFQNIKKHPKTMINAVHLKCLNSIPRKHFTIDYVIILIFYLSLDKLLTSFLPYKEILRALNATLEHELNKKKNMRIFPGENEQKTFITRMVLEMSVALR